MVIQESDLDTLLTTDPEIVAFLLVGRPPTSTPILFTPIGEDEQQGNIADIYLLKDGNGLPTVSSGLQIVKSRDQLFLPIGIVGEVRFSGKPLLSTARGNTVIAESEGGGAA